MHPSRLSLSEVIAAIGGVLLGVGVFLAWYVPNTDNRNAIVAGSREAVSIDRPGEPPGEIGLGLGWFLSFAGVVLMAIGGAMRAGSSERPRKPPGVL